VPTYRERLRVEGLALAACGLIGSVLLLAFEPSSTHGPLSTIVQLAAVAIAMATLGSMATQRALDSAVELEPSYEGTGQPTALWKLPLVVVVLTLVAGELAGWDAGLRVTAGCLIVGLAQALLLERLVAAREARTGDRFHRVPGSRILRGTKVGRISSASAPR
jgi:hypothetical protein